MDEGLVAVEQAMPAGQQVALEPALALVFGQHLDHPAGSGQMLVDLGSEKLGFPLLVGHLEDRLQTVGRSLIGSEDAEVVRIEPNDVGQPGAENLGRLGEGGPWRGNLDAVLAEVGQSQILEQKSAVGMRVVAHPQVARRGQRGDGILEFARLVEQFVRTVGGQPVGEHLQMFRGVAGAGQRHLVGAPRTGGLLAVDAGRTGPSLRMAEDDHRPGRSGLVTGGRASLDRGDLIEHVVQKAGEPAVVVGMVAVFGGFEEVRVVTVADHQRAQLLLRDAVQNGRVGDLVAVEVKDGQDHAVLGGIDELVGVPTGGQRAGLRLTVADDRGDQQVRVVEGGAVGVRERVPQFTALVDGSGRLRGDVRGNASGEGELAEQPPHAFGVLGDVGVGLGVGAVEVGAGHQSGSAVAGAGDVDGGLAAVVDRPVEVCVEKVQSRCGSPVSEQPGFDVVTGQRRAQQRVVQQVDLPDGQVVRGPPPAVDLSDGLVGQLGVRAGAPGRFGCRRHHYPLIVMGP